MNSQKDLRESFLRKQPWLHSPGLDLVTILAPPFFTVAVTLVFRKNFDQTESLPIWAWVGFILCVDVAHVYSSLFRTYLHDQQWKKLSPLFITVPLMCWVIGIFLYGIQPGLFWRVLAYLAVFHFAKQQYGLMRLYSRSHSSFLDKALIYAAVAYPMVYWHTHLPRNFNWFVEGEFISNLPYWMEPLAMMLYALAFVAYFFKEFLWRNQPRELSLPKQLIILGTGLSWYVGIVVLNGDMAFTLINVVSHGIPYMALIWIFGRKESLSNPKEKPFRAFWSQTIFTPRMIPVYLALLVTLAYFEEGLWDVFVWREHLGLFGVFAALPPIESPSLLSWLVPLLTLPQATHYILDGFIWRGASASLGRVRSDALTESQLGSDRY